MGPFVHEWSLHPMGYYIIWGFHFLLYLLKIRFRLHSKINYIFVEFKSKNLESFSNSTIPGGFFNFKTVFYVLPDRISCRSRICGLKGKFLLRPKTTSTVALSGEGCHLAKWQEERKWRQMEAGGGRQPSLVASRQYPSLAILSPFLQAISPPPILRGINAFLVHPCFGPQFP